MMFVITLTAWLLGVLIGMLSAGVLIRQARADARYWHEKFRDTAHQLNCLRCESELNGEEVHHGR